MSTAPTNNEITLHNCGVLVNTISKVKIGELCPLGKENSFLEEKNEHNSEPKYTRLAQLPA
ncbi:hypothetical protein RvY_11760 [Ramazzottius varieornatus]|uniref:Uncharacterized protein n=1 Tax=Ramazzottius varieornatus TaxID=947166 RepID=A0A1D1VJ71_RAMVA|nr:hypothetical protein RvY_11760 [Ramazzottius varieornatus]